MKKYSTENLYLCTLAILKDQTYDYIDSEILSYKVLPRKVLARKEYGEYVDILTGTHYRPLFTVFNDINCCYVYEAFPIITDMEYITKSNAIEILKEANPTFFEVEKEKPKVLRKIFGTNSKNKE